MVNTDPYGPFFFPNPSVYGYLILMILNNLRIVTPDKVVLGYLEVEDGLIKKVGEGLYQGKEAQTDCKGLLAFPGFVDIHIHGSVGIDFMDAKPEDYKTIADSLYEEGVTTFLATTLTSDRDSLERVCLAAKQAKESVPSLGGIHFEGPYISLKYKGAQNPEFIRDPNIEEFDYLQQKSGGFIRYIAMAPEKEGAMEFISHVTKNGVKVAAGHTDASFDQVEEAIKHDRATGRQNPYAFNDENVTRRENNPHDRATLTRTAFARDIEKIINIPAYNRYADKTQVFSFVENDDICRRGLHVQLVSRIARGIGELLGLNLKLIEAIALGHDLGHTPFGHAGERYLSENYEQRTGLCFRHNVHSVRVMDQLYRRNISLQTLDGALCHNGEFAQKVLYLGDCSSFDMLDENVKRCTEDSKEIKKLRPSTLEGCVVRVCDMIAYIGKDRLDAIDVGVIDSLSIFDSDYIGRTNAQIISNMTVDIVNNSYGCDRISMSEEAFQDIVKAKKQNYEKIYFKEGTVSEFENIVQEMFSEMYERLLSDLLAGDESSPVFRHHVDGLVAKSTSVKRDEYLAEEPNRIIVDYISSMTDSYFIALYHHLFPQSEKRLFKREYCDDLK